MFDIFGRERREEDRRRREAAARSSASSRSYDDAGYNPALYADSYGSGIGSSAHGPASHACGSSSYSFDGSSCSSDGGGGGGGD